MDDDILANDPAIGRGLARDLGEGFPGDVLAEAAAAALEGHADEIERLRGKLADILEIAEQNVTSDTRQGYELRLANIRKMARPMGSDQRTGD